MASVRISGKHAILIESATREQQQQVSKLLTEQLIKEIHIDILTEPPNNPTNIRQLRAFLSADQHLNTTPEDLRKRLGIGVAQAAVMLKSTTQKLVQSPNMSLSLRYRADCMLTVKRLQ